MSEKPRTILLINRRIKYVKAQTYYSNKQNYKCQLTKKCCFISPRASINKLLKLRRHSSRPT